MLDLIVIALFQAAAGNPAQPVEQPAQSQEQQAQTSQNEEAAPQRRRCRSREVTGTRLQSIVTCRARGSNGLQDNDTRDVLHDVQRPQPLEGN